MGFAEEGLQVVLKISMERILSERPSAKCPFSCIIMEKGGYWVGVCYVVVFLFLHSLSLNLSMISNSKHVIVEGVT